MSLFKKTKMILLGLLGLIASSSVCGAEYDITNQAQLEAYVDGVLVPLMKKANSQSAVIQILKDGELLLSKGYGYQNIEQGIEVDPDTSMFRPGSISKLYTWLAVMQLVEQGKLDLDVDVNAYLKSFKIHDTYPGQPVTLRHILTHTAGFEDGWLGYLIFTDVSKILPLAESMAKTQPARVYAPGEVVAYSNWATAVAGLIVANVSGEDFQTYIENHFFKPLAMEHATFREPLPANLAQFEAKPYAFIGGQYVEQDFELISNFAPAGASSMSASDMVTFGQMILNGGQYNGHQIIKPETLQYMLDNGYTKDPRLNGMAMGFMEWAYGNKSMALFGHGGATTRFFSHLGISKPEGLVIFMSVSADNQVLSDFLDSFYSTFFPEPVNDLKAPENFSDYGAKYTGTYVSSRDNFSGVESLFRVMSNTSVSLMPDNSLLVDGERYIQQEGNLFRHLDKSKWLAFIENAQGDVTGYVYDGWGISENYRAKWWETASYNYLLLTLCSIVCALVLVRAPLQWRTYSEQGKTAKRVYFVTPICAASHLLFVLFMALAISDSDALMDGIPLVLKVALFFSTLSVPVSLYHLFTTIQSWRGKGITGTWSKVKHTLISAIGLMMVAFYYCFNLIGFNYIGS